MNSRFSNKFTYSDIFPNYQNALVGTEYRQAQPQTQPQTQPQYTQPLEKKTVKKIDYTIIPSKFKKPQSLIKKENVSSKSISTETEPESTNQDINPIPYDKSKHGKIPKSELDIPLYVALKMTYPNEIQKYKTDAQRYGYFIDHKLTDKEHLVLVNPKKNITIFGVRGTNPENFNDIVTNVAVPFYGIKNLDRYKLAEKKNEEIKLKYKNNKIIKIGHSLGGLIQSVLSSDDEKVYTYNRPYSYPVKDNEIAISVETDPLYQVNKIDRKKIKTIPRNYYELARDYVGIKKSEVNPDYEEEPNPIVIPNKYKTDLEVVAYKNLAKATTTAAQIGFNYYNQPVINAAATINRINRISQRVPQFNNLQSFNDLQMNLQNPITTTNFLKTPYGAPLLLTGLTMGTSYLSRRYSNSHALENLPLNIRIESN
jgi:hypothetical protein